MIRNTTDHEIGFSCNGELYLVLPTAGICEIKDPDAAKKLTSILEYEIKMKSDVEEMKKKKSFRGRMLKKFLGG